MTDTVHWNTQLTIYKAFPMHLLKTPSVPSVHSAATQSLRESRSACIFTYSNMQSSFFQTNVLSYVRFEVLTAVVMKSSTFSDIKQCSPLKINRRLGGTCRLHLQNRRISLCLARFILLPWRWRRHLPPKSRMTFNGLHGVISWKIKLFKCFVMPLSLITTCPK
jgi:hypothetical protein